MEINNSDQDDLWMQCPEGMLRQVGRRSAERSPAPIGSIGQINLDRRRLLKLAGVIVVTAGAGTIAYDRLFNPDMRGGHGGVSCKTFVANLKKYILKGLDDRNLIDKMDQHLKYCKGCQKRHNKMRNSLLDSSEKNA